MKPAAIAGLPRKSPGKGGFPIVGIGASAGGLEAFEAFFKAMPPDSGIAFVLVAHLDPGHVSLLPELLQKRTSMPVSQVKRDTLIEPDAVYVIPPKHDLVIRDRTLRLEESTRSRGVNLPIDTFFRSLAQAQGANAVGIILSGTGTDGTLGVRAIKGETGMVMVQDEASCKYDGMPRSALATGLADYVLPPEKMPEQLVLYTQHAAGKSAPAETPLTGDVPGAMNRIFAVLRDRTGHDFSLYKPNTIFRRIERRLSVHQIDELADYVRYLRDSDREAGVLFRELLIGVTSFFRDPEAFAALKQEIVSRWGAQRPADAAVRVWVPGCASGEEAYSIAILLDECMQETGQHRNLQVFGTDLDDHAISTARAAVYPASIAADVTPERLKKYFVEEDDGRYRIKKKIREMLVFAPQSVIKDPPFTKLDLLSCRNLLIYLGPELQSKLLTLFHYSLRPDGLLFLGSSETIGRVGHLFKAADRKWKLFRREPSPAVPYSALDFPLVPPPRPSGAARSEGPLPAEGLTTIQLVEAILQQSAAPPCAIIDEQCDVIYVHGRMGRYLEPPEGRMSINILQMARPGLRTELSAAIRHVATHKQPVTRRDLRLHGDLQLDLTVKPILEFSATRGLMMVVFEEARTPQAPPKSEANAVTPPTAGTAEDVERELRKTRESLQATIEELETSNEELKSTNEELQSTNEELQSTNEEMETSKEELQSLNEEASTVNAEMQSRIDELSQANDDMKNLMDSTEIATVFLDADLCVRRFTPRTTEIIPLEPSDSGRPFRHFATDLLDGNLAKYAEQVLRDLLVKEVEVASRAGRHFTLRIRPYRTVNNVIDGVVLTFEDITTLKQAEQKRREFEERFRVLFEQASEPVALIDPETLAIVEFNQQAHQYLGYGRPELEKLTLADLASSEAQDEIRRHLQEVVRVGRDTFKTRLETLSGEFRIVEIRGRVVTIAGRDFVQSTWHALEDDPSDN